MPQSGPRRPAVEAARAPASPRQVA